VWRRRPKEVANLPGPTTPAPLGGSSPPRPTGAPPEPQRSTKTRLARGGTSAPRPRAHGVSASPEGQDPSALGEFNRMPETGALNATCPPATVAGALDYASRLARPAVTSPDPRWDIKWWPARCTAHHGKPWPHCSSPWHPTFLPRPSTPSGACHLTTTMSRSATMQDSNALGARHASRGSWDICHRLYATAGTPEPPASVMQTIHVPGSGHLSSLN